MFAITKIFSMPASKQIAAFSKVTGTVKFFDVTKGYGFITPSDNSGDIFVHQTAIHAEGFRSLAEGEPVEFSVEIDSRKGKSFASSVTGPNGSFVQGAPRNAPGRTAGRNPGSERGRFRNDDDNRRN